MRCAARPTLACCFTGDNESSRPGGSERGIGGTTPAQAVAFGCSWLGIESRASVLSRECGRCDETRRIGAARHVGASHAFALAGSASAIWTQNDSVSVGSPFSASRVPTKVNRGASQDANQTKSSY